MRNTSMLAMLTAGIGTSGGFCKDSFVILCGGMRRIDLIMTAVSLHYPTFCFRLTGATAGPWQLLLLFLLPESLSCKLSNDSNEWETTNDLICDYN
jgi:hypothetical protein